MRYAIICNFDQNYFNFRKIPVECNCRCKLISCMAVTNFLVLNGEAFKLVVRDAELDCLKKA